MIRDRILAWARARKPDFVIGGADAPYLKRWWVIPRNRLLNVYLHQFLRSDDDRALHTHPWVANASWLLAGAYLEHTVSDRGVPIQTMRRAGDWAFRWGPAPHRIELLPARIRGNGEVVAMHPCWTLFITGFRVREWGFLCPKGWVHWRDFTDARDSGAVGKGCDQ